MCKEGMRKEANSLELIAFDLAADGLGRKGMRVVADGDPWGNAVAICRKPELVKLVRRCRISLTSMHR